MTIPSHCEFLVLLPGWAARQSRPTRFWDDALKGGMTKNIGIEGEVQLIFLIPWYTLSDDQAAFFEGNLHENLRHITPYSPYGERRSQRQTLPDDVLYRLDYGTYAQVHLTHTRIAPETVPGVHVLVSSKRLLIG